MMTIAKNIVENLIGAARCDLLRLRTITRGDGSTFESIGCYGIAREAQYSVYVVPVTARTRPMKEHYRATFYVADKRVSRAAFEQALLGGCK
jgi:hypothetical protein